MGTPLQAGDPDSIGGYRILARLGSGGMGTVYLADDVTGAYVAVKMIKAELVRHEDGAISARFRREIAALRRLGRRCTAALLDADPDGDPPYLVVEYIDGPALSQAVRRDGPLRGAALEEVAVGVAAALEHIHGQGIAHRDLKPANVLLGPHGPRVIDFGIALLTGRDTRITATGQLWGTPPYMAPEQLLGERVTNAADLFAWAGTVAYAASGVPPFGDDRRTVHTRILHGEPVLGGLHGPLLDLVRRSFAKEPAARPSAAEIVDGLRNLSGTVLRNASLGTGRQMSADDAEGWAEKAGQSLAEGKTQLALYQAQRGLAIEPLHPRCLFRRAQANLAEGGHGLQDLQLAYEVNPDDREIRRAFARELVARGSERDVNKAHDLEPGDPAVSLAYARSLARRGRVERAFEIAPGDLEVRRRYARKLADEPAGVLEAVTLLPEDPHIVSRYRSLARRTAGSPDVPPDALGEILALTHELRPPLGLGLRDIDLNRVNDALMVLAKTNSDLPIEARAHLHLTLTEGLRAVIRANSGGLFSLELAAGLEHTAKLADFLYPGNASLRTIAREAYGSWAWTEHIPVGCGCVATLSISLVYPVVAVAWLGWARAVPVAFLSWLGLGLLIFVGLSVGHVMRREARRRKAHAMHAQSDR